MKASESQIRAALDAPDGTIRLFLLYGPDASGAAALADRLPRGLGGDAERIDLEPGTLKGDPARLADEAASFSLFGGARYLRVRDVGDDAIEAFELLLSADRAGSPVVALGPSLKASGKLVKLALGSSSSMAYAAYPPEGGKADQVATAIAREHGLRPIGDVAGRIVAATAGDRAVMTREIEKFALYLDAAPDRPRDLTAETLDEVGADLGESEMMRLVSAAIDGDIMSATAELGLAGAGGASSIPLLRALARRLVQLAQMRSEIDAGSGLAETIERHRIFFKEKPLYNRALRRWTAARLAGALGEVRRAERAVVASGGIGDLAGEAVVVRVVRSAARN